jgi:predicted PurR-regulated permease PerM
VLGAKLLGAVGALLAVPVAAALQVVVGVLVRRYGPAD